ncbi:MAG TPA: transcriptional regulator, partial [Phycisphaerales bacterium]|nr:transcriptional regulator [Phycisphaerales bacterium]
MAPRPKHADATRDEDIDRFIEAWGRMGSVWGISRTMA